MILNFKVKNYRSYKAETTFTMLAETSRSKMQNVAEIGITSPIKTLKSAVIFGANASGKSNILKALGNLIDYIIDKPRIQEEIELYEPYLFDEESKNMPSEFELDFVGPSGVRFLYSITITKNAVLSEKLEYTNSLKKQLIYRQGEDDNEKPHKGIYLSSSNKSIEVNIFPNQLLLSRFGTDEPHDILSEIFKYFFDYDIVLNRASNYEQARLRSINNLFVENPKFLAKVNQLVRAADTRIDEIELIDVQSLTTRIESIDEKINLRNRYQVFSTHRLYIDGKKSDKVEVMNFRQESRGSQMLYFLGGLIILALERGGKLVIDELDTSLHPFLTRLIVMLFQSEKINKKHAQLIFTSHDISLMNRDLLRKDQIWFAEKNEPGESELYSLQDFDNLREDTPFDKWYLAGKFGALPNIKSIEHIFDTIDGD